MDNTIESLNKSWWYRLIKIIYIFFFVVIILLSFVITRSLLSDKEISSISFERIGQEIKKLNQEELNSFSDYEVGKRAYERGSSKLSEYTHLISYDYKYTNTEKNVYYFFSILGVIFIFEIIKRIFYYIALGSINPRKK